MNNIYTLIILSIIYCGTVSNNHAQNNFSKKKVASQNDVYTYVEEMPSFIGGEAKMRDYLSKNLTFPKEAKLENVNSRAIVQFIVKEDGSIAETEMTKSSNSLHFDTLIIKVINEMPPWIAGKKEGKKVKVKMQLPINICFQ